MKKSNKLPENYAVNLYKSQLNYLRQTVICFICAFRAIFKGCQKTSGKNQRGRGVYSYTSVGDGLRKLDGDIRNIHNANVPHTIC